MVSIAVASNEPDPNVVPDEVHVVLSPAELATIVYALRIAGIVELTDRLDAISRSLEPPARD
jgi:hypothetical protein